jgi:hypothetical protein
MPETRRLKRRHLLYYLRVSNARTRKLIGHLADITSDGVMLVSERRIRLGRTIPLRIALPGQPRGGQKLEFEVVSLWHRRDVNPDLWDVGCRTADLTRRQAATIETLIDDYGFRD